MTDDFFSGLRQLDKSMAGVECKMPFFNRDGRIFSVSFPAPIGHLRKLIANRDVSPARVLPGMGLVQLSAYELHDTDAGSFNEFSVVIPLYSPRFPKLPSYNLKKTSAAGEGESDDWLTCEVPAGSTGRSQPRTECRIPRFI